MFKTIAAWLASKLLGDPSVYSDRERLIFKYWNGERFVHADPVALYGRVMEHGPFLSIKTKVARSESKNASQALKDLTARIREIFNVKPMWDGVELRRGDEGTLGDIEVKLLLDRFMTWSEDVKKNSPLLRTLPRRAASKTSSAEDPLTPNSTDSGSTDGESGSDEAAPSLSGPPSPSESSNLGTSTGEPLPTETVNQKC